MTVPQNWKGEKITAIKTSDLEAFLDAITTHPVTRNTIRRDLITLWSHAEKKGWVKDDAASTAKKVPRVKEEISTYPVLTVEQTSRLLEACRVESSALAASVAIAAFCPMRPEELSRLTWDKIDLEECSLDVEAMVARKKGQRRVIRIPSNCLAWIALVPEDLRRGKVVPINRKNMFDRARARAGFKPSFMGKKDAVLQALIVGKELETLPDNVLRHSAISYALALSQDLATVSFQAGNSADVIREYYLGLVKPSNAQRYFEIVPALTEQQKLARNLAEVFGAEGAKKLLEAHRNDG